MELYTTSSYNEGETMSSISEKSSMSNNNHNHNNAIMTTSLSTHHQHMDDNHHHPHALSTYLVDPPMVMPRSVTLDQVHSIYNPNNVTPNGELISPYIHRHVHHHPSPVPASLTIEGLAQLAQSVAEQTSNNTAGGGNNDQVDSANALYSVVNKQKKDNNYEDTESEYAVELRRQAYLQAIGEF